LRRSARHDQRQHGDHSGHDVSDSQGGHVPMIP
jgi:hypothetical protein